MSLHRYAARRDENEPEIRKRFAHHWWHTEQVSGVGMPDLIAWPPAYGKPFKWPAQSALLVDVKTPAGGFKPAQVKKWTALAAKGIPIYVARTEADVDAIVAGTARPWDPSSVQRRPRCNKHGCREPLPCAEHTHHLMANYAPPPVGRKGRLRAAGATLPKAPRKQAERHPDDAAFDAEVRRRIGLKAAREAEETFAPLACCSRMYGPDGWEHSPDCQMRTA